MTRPDTLERYLYALDRPQGKPVLPPKIREPKPVRPKHPTTLRLLRLVENGQVVNQACAATLLGVSHQRVQQIVKAEGLRLGRTWQPNTLITWPCPDCGADVQVWTKHLRDRKTVYCGACSTRARERPVPTLRSCSVSGCVRGDYSRTFCMGHYSRWRSEGDGFDKAPIEEYPHRYIGCSRASCSNGHYAKGLCKNHYARNRTRINWEPARA